MNLMSQTVLNKMLAVKKGLIARTDDAVTKLYQGLQKPALFSGLSRTYKPKDEEGAHLPSEYTNVQLDVESTLREVGELYTKVFDVVLTVDEGNTVARGAVIIDGTVLFEAPVPFLLYVEKQLVHVRTIVSKVPVLDPAVRWEVDTVGSAKWRSVPEETTRSQKVLRNHVLAEATEKHPAQVQTYTADEIVGTWELIKFSGAVTAKERDRLIQRVNDVIDAVRCAVEQANSTEVEQKTVGEAIFAHIFS
jgi:hypothetical protein